MIRNAESQQVIQQEFFVTKHPDLSNNPLVWWWHNPTNPDSLRLTKLAFELLTKVKQHKFYKFKLIQKSLPYKTKQVNFVHLHLLLKNRHENRYHHYITRLT